MVAKWFECSQIVNDDLGTNLQSLLLAGRATIQKIALQNLIGQKASQRHHKKALKVIEQNQVQYLS